MGNYLDNLQQSEDFVDKSQRHDVVIAQIVEQRAEELLIPMQILDDFPVYVEDDLRKSE